MTEQKTEQKTLELKPCPVCKGAPARFSVYVSPGKRSDVIHCPRGCKPNWNSFVVHLRAVDVPDWDDVADAWNTMTTRIDEQGLMRVSFEAYPPHKRSIVPEGPFNHWPRATSRINATRTQEAA